MVGPIDIATDHTSSFILSALKSNAEVLEIGCGEGDVASTLQAAGCKITAIDSNENAVETTRSKGVSAYCASWPSFETPLVDAVVFTRSLHHVHNLDEAIAAARAVLKKGGSLIVEDFAFDEADEATAQWLHDALDKDEIRKALDEETESFAYKILNAAHPNTAWRSDHGHDLHSIAAMEKAIAIHMKIESVARAPYLYRYLISATKDENEAVELIKNFKTAEENAIASGAIVAIGRRIIARTPIE